MYIREWMSKDDDEDKHMQKITKLFHYTVLNPLNDDINTISGQETSQ